jgi:large repetitive protein
MRADCSIFRLRCVPLLLGAIAVSIGCGTRALDRSHDGGTGTLDVDGGASADGRTDAPSGFDGILPIAIYRCGNFVLDPNEQCDDGNAASGDGCSPLCQVECYESCGACGIPGPCPTVPCGNGVLDVRETCDDGNTVSGDGCSGGCETIEPGWRCPVIGRRCAPICGDGLVVRPETCDDANAVGGDGCSAICVFEPQSARCGDGVLQGSEECDVGTANSDMFYGQCSTTCVWGAHCGDGVLNGPEECDLGALGNNARYGFMGGCTSSCMFPHFCGDAILDAEHGEHCDLGVNNGAVGLPCPTTCKLLLP